MKKRSAAGAMPTSTTGLPTNSSAVPSSNLVIVASSPISMHFHPRRCLLLAAVFLSASPAASFGPGQAHTLQSPLDAQHTRGTYNAPINTIAPLQASKSDSTDTEIDTDVAELQAKLSARVEEVTSLREVQAEQLTQIADLAASLANVHGNTEKLQTNLLESQTELKTGLKTMADLIAKVEGGRAKLAEAETLRLDAMTVLEKAGVGGADAAAAADEASAEQVLEEISDSVNGKSTTKEEAAVRMPELVDWKLDGVCATGRVFNHPSIGDGDVIVTSALTNPGEAREGGVVVTESGSQYKLGKSQVSPKEGQMGTDSWQPLITVDDVDIDTPSYFAVPTLDLGMAKSRLDLSGESVGNGRYLLAGSPIISKHGRSEIWSAYRANGYGLPKGEPLCVKLSTNMESMTREDGNYRRVTFNRSNRGKFVKHFEFIPAASEGKKAALVMERGTGDLKGFVEQIGALEGGLLRDAISSAVQCVQAVHSANLVWTDLKAENFVVIEERGGTVGFRGIDLESAIPKGENPVDYSPEACPPEFAEEFLANGGQSFILDPSYDMWSLGALMYELSTGEALFEGMPPLDMTKALAKFESQENIFAAIPNNDVRDLVKQCLQADPKSRSTIEQIAKHPYLPKGFSLFRAFGQ